MREIAVLAVAAVLGWAPIAQAQDAKAGEGVIKSSGCLKCHSVKADKDAPSFKSVAAKYKGQADARANLEKFIAGHRGGPKPKEKAKDAVAYILSR
ncbi:MAG TPA: cytochrome C biogenesis protein CcsA [Burkholderiales bacterium]|jgi:cytochrome c